MSEPLQIDFEKLFVNNENLGRIQSHLNRFNPIKVMKMERMEIRHSSILGWLLNPRENHGLNDEFLKSFLSEAVSDTNASIHALDISRANLSDANIFIEWNNIDIFIECPDQNWVFIIENKVDSTQSKGQLDKYFSVVEKRYGDQYKKACLFLTLNNEEPKTQSSQYYPINYVSVLKLLNFVIEQHEDTLATKVLNFIKYYKEIISELCDMNQDQEGMKKLAKEIYRDHKKVLDFIYEHANSNEFQEAAISLVTDQGNSLELTRELLFEHDKQEYAYLFGSRKWFRFVPSSWKEILEGIGSLNPDDESYFWGEDCKNWQGSYPLACSLDIREQEKNDQISYQIKLCAHVGPTRYRDEMIAALQQSFSNSSSLNFKPTPGKSYSIFISDSEALDDSQNAEKITDIFRSLIKKHEKDFSIVAEGLSILAGNIKNNG